MPNPDPFAKIEARLWHQKRGPLGLSWNLIRQCHNPAHFNLRRTWGVEVTATNSRKLATERELSLFLQSVEKRAFKRSLYHVRDEEAALDIVQDSMMKLAEHYGDKPPDELPLLFQRILSNCTLDWFRRRKTRQSMFINFSDAQGEADEDGFDLLEVLGATNTDGWQQSAEQSLMQSQTMAEIEAEIEKLPPRQREAFLLRYWEELDIAETASAMGCSEGSVKTHCFRAIQTLANVLKSKKSKL